MSAAFQCVCAVLEKSVNVPGYKEIIVFAFSRCERFSIVLSNVSQCALTGQLGKF